MPASFANKRLSFIMPQIERLQIFRTTLLFKHASCTLKGVSVESERYIHTLNEAARLMLWKL